ncbi:MAG: CAP domain-containing protein [Myxococcales bacterium]|nr:CAP domain-containing protein [Myxococcales bacterium]
MTKARTLGWLVMALLLGAGCAASAASTRPTLREHYQAPGTAEAHYRSAPPPGAALTGPHAFRVGQGIEAAPAAEALRPDPRLGQLAAWVLEERGPEGETPPHPVIDLWARHLGMPEPAPHLIVLAQSDPETLAQRIEDELSRVLSSQRYTHYGAATGDLEGVVVTVLALSWRWADFEPLPRRLTPGAPLTIAGKLHADLRDAMLVVSYPDGTSTRAPKQKGRDFKADVPTEQRGEYRVEILAEGKLGTTVVANFPIYVGVEPARSVTVERAADHGERLPPSEVGERLLALINRDRERAGLSPVEAHSPLDAVAAAHSKDMHDHGFVGHTSPTTGGAGDRVKRADIRTPYVLENIGRGYSPEEVHRGLMDSPGHRANVMTPDATHVGIGVVVEIEDERPAYLVTELFGRFAEPIDVDDAVDDLVELLDAERKKRGLPELAMNDTLTELAGATAERFFAEPGSDQNALLQALSKRAAQAGGGYSRQTAMMTVVPALEDVLGIEALLDPAVRGVGLGVAQGTREDTIELGIAIVVVIGY